MITLIGFLLRVFGVSGPTSVLTGSRAARKIGRRGNERMRSVLIGFKYRHSHLLIIPHCHSFSFTNSPRKSIVSFI